jgi:hypothetical protein
MLTSCFPVAVCEAVRNMKVSSRLIFLTLIVLAIQGCASTPARPLLPAEYSNTATVRGIPKARTWGDAPPPWLKQVLGQTESTFHSEYPALFGRPHYYLAISGGGSGGAFATGLLNVWTEAGNRPEFSVVTGVSTGSLIAPYAFIGPGYDHVLKDLPELQLYFRFAA